MNDYRDDLPGVTVQKTSDVVYSTSQDGTANQLLLDVYRPTPDTTPAECVYLSQRDVRELQFAKAAISTGWTLLMEQLGLEIICNTPAQFTQQIKDEIAKWGKVIKDANIKQQ